MSFSKYFNTNNQLIVYMAIVVSLIAGIIGMVCIPIFPHFKLAYVITVIGIFLSGLFYSIVLTYDNKSNIHLIVLMCTLMDMLFLPGILCHHYLILDIVGMGLIGFIVGISGRYKPVFAVGGVFCGVTFICGNGLHPDLLFVYPIFLFLGNLIVYLSILSYFVIKKPSVQDNAIIVSNFYENYAQYVAVFVIATLTAHALALIIHSTHSYWITLTTIILIKPDHDLTASRINDRFYGTLVGSIIAFLLVYFISSGAILTMVACIVILLAMLSVAKHYLSFAIWVTIAVTIMLHVVIANGSYVIKERFIYTILGAVIAKLAHYALNFCSKKDRL